MHPHTLQTSHVVIIAASILSATLFLGAARQPQPTAPPDKDAPRLTGASGVPNPSNVDAQCALRQDMRKLWTEHTVWTRDYIIAAVDDKPDQQAAANRLMKNQEDIGAAFGNYFGKANGDRLTGLLKEHIQDATELIKVAKTKDDSQFKAADERWKRNGDDIADFLNSVNPHWTREAMGEMMLTHLSTTTEEVKARLAQDWDKDIKAYDHVYAHILKMSDALSDGIVRQFPDRFPGSAPKSK